MTKKTGSKRKWKYVYESIMDAKEPYIAEPFEMKLDRINSKTESIGMADPIVFDGNTPEGMEAAYDIRGDKWLTAEVTKEYVEQAYQSLKTGVGEGDKNATENRVVIKG